MPLHSALLVACLLFGGCTHHGAFAFRASPPDAPLPPNSVRIEARVQSCDETQPGTYACRLMANRVIAYGRGGAVTPPETPLDAVFTHHDLGIERSPEPGAKVDVLLVIDSPPGTPRTLRATRLYGYVPTP